MDVRGSTRRRGTAATLAALVAVALAPALPTLAATPDQPGSTASPARPATIPGLVRPLKTSVAGAPAPGVLRSRAVVVDADVLPDTAAEAEQGVDLPLFPDTNVVAELEPPTLAAAGYQVWNGTLSGTGGSSVVLVEKQGSLTGYVADEQGGTFRIRPGADGSSVIEQIDPAFFPEEHEHPAPPVSSYAALRSGNAPAGAHDHSSHDHGQAAVGDGAPRARWNGTAPLVTAAATAGAPVIDVLVAYSTAAKNAKGGLAAMEADAALAVEQTNQAFATSGVDAVLRLAHTVEVPHNGNVDGSSIDRLRLPTDGWNDEVHALRDNYGADLVALIVDDTANQYCGLAYQMTSDSVGFAPYGLSVTDVHCSTGYLTFAHELGHNFGAAHDRGAWSGQPAYPYGYDWVNNTAKWRTVMSYENACSGCTRLLRFSNPDQTHNGAPLGAPIGASNQADNRALLNTTAATVAGFRGAAVPASTTVTSPAAAAALVPAPSMTSITWSKTGNIGSSVRIELLRGSTVVSTLAAAAPAGTGSFAWTVPATLPHGDDYRIRITPTAVPTATSSTDPFSVTTPGLTVTSHSGNGTWAAGVPQTVTWSYTGTPTSRVRLEVVREGRLAKVISTGALIGTAGTGSFTFTPSGLGSYGDYRVRATLASIPAVTDTSDGENAFTGAGTVALTSPNAGETWTAGSSRTITWTSSGSVGAYVKVDLMKGNALAAVIAARAPVGAGSVTWTAPAKLPSGTDYRVLVTATSLPAAFDLTDVPLTLHGTSVGVVAPTGDWVAGSPGTVTWSTVGAPGTALKLELVPAVGRPIVMAASTPLANGTFTWRPPLTVKGDVRYRVRGTVVGNVLVTSTSASDLAVTAPGVSLTSPTGPVTWTLGKPVDVSWSFTDTAAAPVRIQLVRGTSATIVASSVVTPTTGTGTYRWTPPLGLAPAADYKVRVTATTSAAVTATSAFSVELRRPTVALTAPTTSQIWTTGVPVDLSWALSDGVAAPVKLQLVRGTTLTNVVASTVTPAGGAGTYRWTPPLTLAPATDYRLRVTTTGSPNITSTSAFTVELRRPTLALTAPTGGSTLTAGTARSLTWQYSQPVVVPVRVQLLQGTRVIATAVSSGATAAGSGTASWTPARTLPAGSYVLRVRPTTTASTAAIEHSVPVTIAAP